MCLWARKNKKPWEQTIFSRTSFTKPSLSPPRKKSREWLESFKPFIITKHSWKDKLKPTITNSRWTCTYSLSADSCFWTIDWFDVKLIQFQFSEPLIHSYQDLEDMAHRQLKMYLKLSKIMVISNIKTFEVPV